MPFLPCVFLVLHVAATTFVELLFRAKPVQKKTHRKFSQNLVKLFEPLNNLS